MLTPYRNHVLSSWLVPHNFAARIGRPFARDRARTYLEREGVLSDLKAANEGQIRPHLVDLANLHRLIRTRRPSVVLEFGVGFSTIAIAHAISRNVAEGRRPDRAHAEAVDQPRIWSIDANEEWLENARSRIPAHLRGYVELRYSAVRAAEFDGQLCSLFDHIPDVVPDFVYLDAPDPKDIQGAVRGLTFSPETGGYRHAAAADVLLLESTLQVGAFVLLDSRYVNAHFLARNLRRRYRTRWNRVHGWVSFELMDWTGRSRGIRSPDRKRR
jgi:hypothetical protein